MVFLAVFLAIPAKTESLSISQSFNILLEADKSGIPLSERLPGMHEVYNNHFSKIQNEEKLKKISDTELELIFRAAFMMEFYTADQRYRRDMQLSLAELERRDLEKDKHYSKLYGALIHERYFSEAKLLREKHIFLQTNPLPDIKETIRDTRNLPTVLIVDSGKQQLTRRDIDIQIESLIVVVAHPLCHFCQYAVRDIGADKRLSEIFSHHAIWLSPPETKLYFPIFQKWNKAHSKFPMVLAFRQKEWPMIDVWNTPTFYFFKRGEVVAKLTGWPEEGHLQELREGLRRIGLLHATATH